MCECPRPIDKSKNFKHCSDCPELHKKKHKWHKEIKAWADGAQIEYKCCGFGGFKWVSIKTPEWEEDVEYRIKPTSYTIKAYLVLAKSGFYPTVFMSYRLANAWGTPLHDFIKVVEITETIEV